MPVSEVPIHAVEPHPEEPFRQAGQGNGEGKAADESNVRHGRKPPSFVLMPAVSHGGMAGEERYRVPVRQARERHHGEAGRGLQAAGATADGVRVQADTGGAYTGWGRGWVLHGVGR